MNAPPTAGSREMVTIPLLFAGGILVVVGWPAGALLLWTSPVWRIRNKLIGTLMLPGGLFGSVVGILRMPGDLAHPSPLIIVAQCDSGHGILPGGGHEFCPLAATSSAR